jgi:hypothetical protein
MSSSDDLDKVLEGVVKYDEEHIEKYISLSRKRVKSLELFALIAALVAGAAVAELSTFDPDHWRHWRSPASASGSVELATVEASSVYVYVALVVFSVAVSTYCSVVVVMTLAAANRLQVTDSRLQHHSVKELYEEYERPGTLLNHIKNTQPGWSVFLEKGDKRIINFPVSLQWISEKYEELRPFIQLFPISTASFLLGLLLRVLEKVELEVLRILMVALVLPLLWLTFLHSKRANEITFFQIGLKHENVKHHASTSAHGKTLEESRTLPPEPRNERTPLLRSEFVDP